MTNFRYNYISCVCSSSENIQAQRSCQISHSGLNIDKAFSPLVATWSDIHWDGWEIGTTAPHISK